MPSKSTTTSKQVKEEYPVIKTKFNAYTGEEPYLFISYSHRDTAQVYPVLNDLHDMKYRIWYDESCETGNDFRDELRHRIENCSAVVLFVSKASMSSIFCGMEIIVARENAKKIFPIFLESASVVPPAFSILLSNTHHGTTEDMEKLLVEMRRDLPADAMDRLTFENEKDKQLLIECQDNGSSIDVDEGVRIIGKDAFKDKKQLRYINLPSTLEDIQIEAFRGCSRLESIHIPQKTARIGESAFRDCVSMKSLQIENSLIKIGERAFENCANLESVKLPDGLNELYGGVFNSCKKLKTIDLPSKLTVIGENAFSDCVGLEKIKFPDSVTKIDDLVFNGCTSLASVELPENLRKIGKSAFKNCKSLTKVTIPKSVVSIADAPFRGCENLKSIKVDPKNMHYKSVLNNDGSKEGSYVLFNKNKSVLITYPANSDAVQYDVPDSVTVVSDWAFCDSKKLSRISLPDSIIEIGEGAFCNCIHLDRIKIPDSVEKIDDCAFRQCECLEKVIIPDSVKEMGWGVFDGCEGKVVVYCSEGSVAHDYCVRNRINYSILSDEDEE